MHILTHFCDWDWIPAQRLELKICRCYRSKSRQCSWRWRRWRCAGWCQRGFWQRSRRTPCSTHWCIRVCDKTTGRNQTLAHTVQTHRLSVCWVKLWQVTYTKSFLSVMKSSAADTVLKHWFVVMKKRAPILWEEQKQSHKAKSPTSTLLKRRLLKTVVLVLVCWFTDMLISILFYIDYQPWTLLSRCQLYQPYKVLPLYFWNSNSLNIIFCFLLFPVWQSNRLTLWYQCHSLKVIWTTFIPSGQ